MCSIMSVTNKLFQSLWCCYALSALFLRWWVRCLHFQILSGGLVPIFWQKWCGGLADSKIRARPVRRMRENEENEEKMMLMLPGSACSDSTNLENACCRPFFLKNGSAAKALHVLFPFLPFCCCCCCCCCCCGCCFLLGFLATPTSSAMFFFAVCVCISLSLSICVSLFLLFKV